MHGESDLMLDVHPPHEKIHGMRDFFLHLLTITIGLLIAVGIEGCVEWEHHRHLAHEAEASLYGEINSNAAEMQGVIDDIHAQQKTLDSDVSVLQGFIDKQPMKDKSMSISWRIRSFDEVSWKTAQTTGALAYMPYDLAKEYARIYGVQQDYNNIQHQALRDATESISFFAGTSGKDADPSPEDARVIKAKVQILQAQLLTLNSFAEALNTEYKRFLAAHHA
ncbi:hypothetical protein [Silvibacterium acidisoli]|uniref:hypothetical protein n=1 Tax=Acidobacteriaceae bacterium ZG23-2 TaxID=2883246 RepID=UPI00406CE9A7